MRHSAEEVHIKISKSSIGIPNLEINKGEVVGIYTNKPKRMMTAFLRLFLYVDSYHKKGEFSYMNLDDSKEVARVIKDTLHLVIPRLWEEDFLNILKKYRERRLFFIGLTTNEFVLDELYEASKIISKLKPELTGIVVTDSMDVIEALCDRVFNEKGQEYELSEEYLVEPVDKDLTFSSIDDIPVDYALLRFRKKRLKKEVKK